MTKEVEVDELIAERRKRRKKIKIKKKPNKKDHKYNNNVS